MFSRGFAAGAVTSVAVYALYSSLVQPTRKEIEADIRAIRTPEELVRDKGLKGSNIFKYGTPDRGAQTRVYINHALSYDQDRRTPHWVAEHITKDDLQGTAIRKKANFKMDPNLNATYSSMNSDYKGSGWSRGHMAPAADNKFSQEAMDETFYLTNIVPQDIDNNMNFWNLMEIYCRDLTAKFSEVRVISGPMMMPNVNEDDKQYVKYEVIGNNLVAVPTHLFKVIAVESNESSTETVGVGAFVVPNAPIDSTKHTLEEYKVSLDVLEKSAGTSFLPNLTRSSMVDLCSLDPCQLKSKKELNLFFITKRINEATTVNRLDTSWKELESRRIVPDDNLRNLYAQKRQVLMEKESGHQQVKANGTS
ncbi:nuclease EXOG, mitochondrial-like [Lytechinus pictus]|uniref:nuclease EXOG, mitochondrial-like n=1 Tax=Lytechinus pictus TaxID=7653 RepID=UPI0030BA22F3